tara:strand:+ start:76 stop:753 length:678 start_codon:yes stop_codon:yes gene_type:complete
MNTILLLLLLSIGFYIIYRVYHKVKQIYLGRGINIDKINSQLRNSIPACNIAKPLIDSSFTISFWIYIKDFYYNSDCKCWKHIIHKGSFLEQNEILNYTNWNTLVSHIPEQSLGIWMHPNVNNLRVAVNVDSQVLPNIEYCDITNIPSKKYVHITIRVNDNNIEVYRDGKLTTTKLLSNKLVLNNKDMYFNYQNTYNGNLYNFYYFPNKITSKQIQSLYKKKPKV